VAEQFGVQILIEPVVTGAHQDDLAGEAYEKEGSVIYRIAAETGMTYKPCATFGCHPLENAYDFVYGTTNRDLYQYDKYAGYIDEIGAFALKGLNFPGILSAIFQRDIALIPYLGARYRVDAYKYIESESQGAISAINSPAFEKLPAAIKIKLKYGARTRTMKTMSAGPESGNTLEEALGILNQWDDYVVGCNYDVLNAFYDNSAISPGYAALDPMAVSTGELFLQNLALVRTFITNSELDLVIYAPVIPDTLKKYPGIVKNVVWNNETNDGYIDVYYKPGSLSDVETPDKRTIYFPHYASSGHMVSLAQPDKFFDDVRKWLNIFGDHIYAQSSIPTIATAK
jgi:hypothetical protein